MCAKQFFIYQLGLIKAAFIKNTILLEDFNIDAITSQGFYVDLCLLTKFLIDMLRLTPAELMLFIYFFIVKSPLLRNKLF